MKQVCREEKEICQRGVVHIVEECRREILRVERNDDGDDGVFDLLR